MSKLALLLRTMIRSDGPIALETFMAFANGHPTLGYYATRDPFGTTGDFTTAPEISQMFGELLGLWIAQSWRLAGAPSPAHFVELGPGRGTMMADALRAVHRVAGFCDAVQVHLVETSATLVARQRATLARYEPRIIWHSSIETLPDGPLFVLANEFFDALPVQHFVRTAQGWRRRMVGLNDDDAFRWGLSDGIERDLVADGDLGAVIEIGVAARQVMRDLAGRIVRQGGAMLAIDYGHARTQLGETLQAMRGHRFVDPLATPGDADLTTHVDFDALAREARAAGALVSRPVPQGLFLERLGIRERARMLARNAAPDAARSVEQALHRLADRDTPTAMGALFKALAVASPTLPPLPGFDETAS